jgi:F0F1-type ATP synthase assembly protein I
VQEKRGKDGGEPLRQYALALSLGMNFAVGMAVFAALGWYLGRKAGAPRTGLLGGMLAGLLYGAYEVWRAIRQIEPSGGGQSRSGRAPSEKHGQHSDTG